MIDNKITMDLIHKSWDKDSEIDRTDLNNTSYNIPKHHSKYTRWLSLCRMVKSKLEAQRKQLNLLKRQYYGGELDKETLDIHGWSQFQKKVLKADMASYIEADPDINTLDYKIECEEHKIKSIEYIVRQLQIMNMHVRNINDRDKFMNGEL